MKVKSIILMVLCCIVFGSELLLTKYLLVKGVDAFTLAVLVVSVASILISPVFLSQKKIKFTKRVVLDLGIIGFLATGLAILFQNIGLTYTSVSNAGFLLAVVPLFTVLFSHYMLKEKLPKRFLLVMVLICVGVVLISSKGKFTQINRGDMIILASTMLLGFTNSYAKKIMKYIPALLITAGRMVFGAVFLVVLSLITGKLDLGQVTRFWFLVLVLGVLFVLTRLLFYKSIDLESSSIISTFILATYPLVAVAAYFFLGEKMVMVQITGAILVITGVFTLTNVESSTY